MQTLANTTLQGAVPAASLYASCRHFVDRLCVQDLKQLQAIVALLDGCTLRTASTCSGLDSCVPVMQHTLAALNARFGVRISTRHVFSAENDPARQAFIRHGDQVEFLCHDVSEISKGTVTNILTSGNLRSLPVSHAYHSGGGRGSLLEL